MSKKSVLCITTSIGRANLIVDRLRSEAFSNNDISFLCPDKPGARDCTQQKPTKASEGAAAGPGSGSALGGALGWLAGIGPLTIPGGGPFVASGPVVAALSGATMGAAVGGFAGALILLGVPEAEAKRYEAKVKQGNILISVHTDNSDEIRRAHEIFEESGAEYISTAGVSSPKDKTASTALR